MYYPASVYTLHMYSHALYTLTPSHMHTHPLILSHPHPHTHTPAHITYSADYQPTTHAPPTPPSKPRRPIPLPKPQVYDELDDPIDSPDGKLFVRLVKYFSRKSMLTKFNCNWCKGIIMLHYCAQVFLVTQISILHGCTKNIFMVN